MSLRILVVGAGLVARYIFQEKPSATHVFPLCRSDGRIVQWRALGAKPVQADLDHPSDFHGLQLGWDAVFYLAPPSGLKLIDERLKRFLSNLSQSEILPRHLIYMSTTGVYGSSEGAWVTEVSPVNPESERAQRRVWAERYLRHWALRNKVSLVILRAPGIYDEERLPKDGLKKGMLPVPLLDQDPWSNHIHAHDLARLVWMAYWKGRSNRIYNACDLSQLTVGAYYELCARYLDLPAPNRLPREELRALISPMRWSFLRESRRIYPARVIQEWGFQWLYPTVEEYLKKRNTGIQLQ